MTVLCANCHTANRDRAMFCIGCAGKLPAFAATGPSALQALDDKAHRAKSKVASRTASPDDGHALSMAHAPRGLIAAVLLLGATVLALAAWISFGPGRTEAPGIAQAAAPLKTLPATPVAAPAPAAQVPVEAALAPGESTVPSTPARSAATVIASAPPPAAAAEPTVRASPAPTVTRTERQPAPQRVASVTNASASCGAADPRVGCEQLFFVLAARCEASHCDEAAYTRHPRCNVVRDQRRRDEARRNLTSGF